MDARLREAERGAWSGDVSARARLLVERVRLGDLSDERLRLLAHVGDPGARLGLGLDPAAPTALVQLVIGLGAFGQDVCVRAALAAGWAALRVYTPTRDYALLRRGLGAAERSLRRPGAESREQAASTLASLQRASAHGGGPGAELGAAVAGVVAAEGAAAAEVALRVVAEAAALDAPGGAERVRDGIAGALIGWALASAPEARSRGPR